jgi:hypothetical protein
VSVAPEVLFIERCVDWLKAGGRMGIVLPDGILGNPGDEYIRWWTLRHTWVLASTFTTPVGPVLVISGEDELPLVAPGLKMPGAITKTAKSPATAAATMPKIHFFMLLQYAY